MGRFGRARYLVASGFVTGILVSALELVCTGQIYLPAIQLMSAVSKTRLTNLGWLTLYNLSFIAPLFAVFGFAYYGTTAATLGGLLRRHLALTKALMAVFFIAAAVLLVVTTW